MPFMLMLSSSISIPHICCCKPNEYIINEGNIIKSKSNNIINAGDIISIRNSNENKVLVNSIKQWLIVILL